MMDFNNVIFEVQTEADRLVQEQLNLGHQENLRAIEALEREADARAAAAQAEIDQISNMSIDEILNMLK